MIQDSKLGNKLITLLEKTPAGEAFFKDIAENIENELSEYNEAMLQYEDQLTAYETALDDFINPAFLPKEDEAATDQIIAEAEAGDTFLILEEEVELLEDEEIIFDAEIIIEEDAAEGSTEEETTQW